MLFPSQPYFLGCAHPNQMEKNSIRIRRIALEELDEIIFIENLSFSKPWPRDVFIRELQIPISRTLVATVCRDLRDEIAGYLTYWVVAGELQVHKICVRDGLRKSGIASSLMAEMIRLSCREGVGLCTLEVGHSNEAAKRLYTKFGFEVIEIRPKYYSESGEDAMILRADLKKCLQLISKA